MKNYNVAKLLILMLILTQFSSCSSKGKLTSKPIEEVKPIVEYDNNTVVESIDTFSFGAYQQKDVSGNSYEPIDWIVLEKDEEKMLLFSKYILDCKCYHNDIKDVTWETCDLREWLNNDFYYDAFSDEEREKIITTTVINTDTNDKTRDGNATNDKVFLLSADETKKYFGIAENKNFGYQVGKIITTEGTNYAKSVDNDGIGLWVYDSNTEETEEDKEKFKWANGNSPYWLRTAGETAYRAMYVRSSGYISAIGDEVTVGREGVRPAIWVKR